jgi:RNA polymerase sigma factor (sigma-70 family)
LSPSITTSVSIRLLSTQSDARLIELSREGHERAFEALVQRYRRPLHAYCRRLLLPDTRAEDAVQQGLLRAWLALRDGTEVRDAKPWLYRIVHNAALNIRRGAGYDYAELSETLTGSGAPEEDLDRRIAVREALAGLAALPELQREALLQTAVDGHSHQDVAASLGVSEGALRGLVYRARSTMRAAATAATPWPVVNWLAGSGSSTRATPLIERLAELGAGGGSIGLSGLLLKGGAVAVSAGALVTGIGAVHPHSHASRHPAQANERPAVSTKLVAAQEPALRAVAPDSAVFALGGVRSTRGSDSPRHRRGDGSPMSPSTDVAGQRRGGSHGGGDGGPRTQPNGGGDHTSGSDSNGSSDHSGSGSGRSPASNGAGDSYGSTGAIGSGSSTGDGHGGSGTSGSGDDGSTSPTSGSGTSHDGRSSGGDSSSTSTGTTTSNPNPPQHSGDGGDGGGDKTTTTPPPTTTTTPSGPDH